MEDPLDPEQAYHVVYKFERKTCSHLHLVEPQNGSVGLLDEEQNSANAFNDGQDE